VYEHIFAAALRLNEPVTLGRIEPLHSAGSHAGLLLESNRNSVISSIGNSKSARRGHQSLAIGVPDWRGADLLHMNPRFKTDFLEAKWKVPQTKRGHLRTFAPRHGAGLNMWPKNSNLSNTTRGYWRSPGKLGTDVLKQEKPSKNLALRLRIVSDFQGQDLKSPWSEIAGLPLRGWYAN
jgi:hypothetical protein